MITCVAEYVIEPAGIDVFERFGRRWIELRYERTFARPRRPSPSREIGSVAAPIEAVAQPSRLV